MHYIYKYIYTPVSNTHGKSVLLCYHSNHFLTTPLLVFLSRIREGSSGFRLLVSWQAELKAYGSYFTCKEFLQVQNVLVSPTYTAEMG